MTYLLLFYEFLKIGLLAIGGGLVTVPFLFDLAEKYKWYTAKELTDMIAVAESTPGPVGINMATFAGFNTAGLGGALIATLGLVLPSVVIMVMVAKLMNRYQCNVRVRNMLEGVRPAVIALILTAGLTIGQMAVADILSGVVFAFLFAAMRFWRKSPVFYLCLAAVLGIVLKI